MIRAGARLVQVYTGLIYEGPLIARRVNRGLLRLMAREGIGSIGELQTSAPGEHTRARAMNKGTSE